MKKICNILVLSLLVILTGSCADFLDVKPNGVLDESDINGPDQVDAMVIAAYSMLGNDHYGTPWSLWPYGNVRSDDAYKGGRDESDIQAFHFLETASNILPTMGEPDGFWYQCYISISRCNKAINMLNKLSVNEFPERDHRMAECRFLRGHFYFLLKIMFKYVPYIDNEELINNYGNVSNRQYTNDELWDKIAADFQAAFDVLPVAQSDAGRPDRYAAAAYLAKTYLYKAYRQDEEHNVTEINAGDLDKVLTLTQEVMGGGRRLEDDYAYNFLPGEYENGKEAIWSVQYSQEDGTKFGRLNFGDVLNVPMKFTGSCDFHKPSQNLVNAFKTQDGLPEFGVFNQADYDASVDNVDPRLYHTVALLGEPYKYDLSTIFGEDWSRTSSVYGYYSSLKENVALNDPHSVLLDPFRGNSKNRIVIRYADVLLMRAEALIELRREKEAMPLINDVRSRAKKSLGKIPYATNTEMALYEDGVNCAWNMNFARQALRFERRIEFAMEGSRFFDLVRWGVADEVLNTYFKEETPKIGYYKGVKFQKNKLEYLPIPQNQINFSKKLYQQNYNY